MPANLEIKVDTLFQQVTLLTQVVAEQQKQQAAQQASVNSHRTVVEEDEEMEDFITEEMDDVGGRVTESGKMCLPKYMPPQVFHGTREDTKSFINSVVLYISGHHPEFCTTESKIGFALSYIQGGKVQFWRNEAINKIVAGHKLFKNFCDFLNWLEAQFSDPNPDVTAKGKLKVMRRGVKTVDEFILEFKSEASHSNLGDVALIKYLKVGLNQSLFKSIYCLLHMLTMLMEWYEWAMKLDRQYHQEQAESKLFRHTPSGSKTGKPMGKSFEKTHTPTMHVERALPLAMAVTPECAPDAMDVD